LSSRIRRLNATQPYHKCILYHQQQHSRRHLLNGDPIQRRL